MSDNLELVILSVGGSAYAGFEKIGVGYGAKQAARTFGATLTENTQTPFGPAWNLMPGQAVSITANGDVVLVGHIEGMSPSYSATEHKVEIQGRSKSGDTVDSSAMHDTSEFKNKTILQVAQELDKQGVGFSTDVSDLQKLPIFRINTGETIFQAVERIARKQQLLLVGQADGSIKIQKGGKERVHAALIEGKNILGASAQFGDAGRHSKYHVKGQRAYGGLKNNSIRVTGEAEDGGVKRNRPKVIIPETDVADKKDASKRAKHHADRAQGEGVRASVKCQGWRCSNGILWKPNTLVTVISPMLHLSMDMLIETVSLAQDSSGSFSQLSLVHPKALGSDAGGGPGASKEWASDTSES